MVVIVSTSNGSDTLRAMLWFCSFGVMWSNSTRTYVVLGHCQACCLVLLQFFGFLCFSSSPDLPLSVRKKNEFNRTQRLTRRNQGRLLSRPCCYRSKALKRMHRRQYFAGSQNSRNLKGTMTQP